MSRQLADLYGMWAASGRMLRDGQPWSIDRYLRESAEASREFWAAVRAERRDEGRIARRLREYVRPPS